MTQIKSNTNFEPGEISEHGFLGNDSRLIEEIIEADKNTLAQLKITQEEIASILQFFIEQGKKGYKCSVDLGDFIITLDCSNKGVTRCPFGDQVLFPRIIATVFNKRLSKEIKYSQLNVHMIREHCFFEGKGSIFRLEPEEILNILNIT